MCPTNKTNLKRSSQSEDSEIVRNNRVSVTTDGDFIVVPITITNDLKSNGPVFTITKPPLQTGWKRNQYFASIASNVGALAFGTMFGWTATALPDIRKSGVFGATTLSEESWIGSIMLLGALVSGLVTGYFVERLGRRMTMLLLSAPCLVGWALIIFAQNVEMIYAGRFLTGFAGGAYAIVVPIYVAETSDPDIRGKLSAGFDMGIAGGILYIVVIGYFLDWRYQAVTCAALTVVGHVLVMFLPESPRWLVTKDKFEESIKALCWIHNVKNPELVLDELAELKVTAAATLKMEQESTSWTDLFKPHILKPSSVGLMIHLFSSISANIPITAYTVDIFVATGTGLDEYVATIIFGITDFLSALAAAVIVDKYGRRPLLMISQFLMGITLGTAGVFFYLKEQNGGVSPDGLDWLPVTCLGVFIAAFAFGTGPISYMLMGEILPPEAKGSAAGAANIIKWLSAFFVTKYFLDIMSIFGESVGYWFFAVLCVIGGFYVIFCVPETKGKTLEEIQLKYQPK